jgi:hypothetical protein
VENDQKGLFNAEKLDGPLPSPAKGYDLDKMDVAELLELRQRIEARLPARKLEDIDLEQEIVFQYQGSKALLAKVTGDDGTPANQKAQVANSCASVLDQLLKMQTRIYSAERIKAIEQALVKAVKTLPVEAQQQFFVDYERISAEGV